ncbi:hypothetical protein ABK040_007840 [Willaertia magna]
MRSSPIGLYYSGEKNRYELIRTAIESGRITHNHVNGFMGALVSALFTAYAIESIEPKKWGHLFMNNDYNKCLDYLINDAKRDAEQIRIDMAKFKAKFEQYLKERGLTDGVSDPIFPTNYDIQEREVFYKKWSYDGWAGSSGDDSVIIAYDALLGSNGNWEELLHRAALHGGDSDSTGTIAGAWYGALYGLPDRKFENNWKDIEYADRIRKVAEKLYEMNAELSKQ